MFAKHVLGETALRVGLAVLIAHCPKFNEDLPPHVRSPVGVETFEIGIAAVESPATVLKMEEINNLLSLCNEIGFPPSGFS
jgi:hypothetical protein